MDLLLLTTDPNPESVLPSLALLPHTVRAVPTEVSSLLEAGSADIAIVDARTDLAAARGLCRLLGTTGASVPVVAVVNEGGLVAVNVDWGIDEILLPGTGPAEIELREAGRRTGYRMSLATLYTMLARRAAGLPAPQGRRARRVS